MKNKVVSCLAGSMLFICAVCLKVNAQSFQAVTPSLQTGSSSAPYFMATGDLNNDGKPDLVVANNSAGNISVFINKTTPFGSDVPTFTNATQFVTSSTMRSVAIGDINGDGLSDIVVCWNTTASVFINTTAKGDTTLSFAARVDYPVSSGAICIVIGDVNGDGKPDMITANYDTGTMTVLLNTTATGSKTASFLVRPDIATNANPFSVNLGDLNRDGMLDLAVANTGSDPGNISVYINKTVKGDTTLVFTKKDFATATNQPFSVCVKDIDNDGIPDVAVSNGSSGANTVSVFFNKTVANDTIPAFATRQDFTAGTTPRCVLVGDFNGDLKPDLAVANNGDNTVTVFVNKMNISLPVELVSFSAILKGNTVDLNWKTATETNNSGFNIERSVDNSAWQTVAFVAGKGNCSVISNYTYSDKLTNLSTNYYYRLKQIDYDGTYKYTNVALINVVNPLKYELIQNYPNPFNPSTTISYSVPEASNVKLIVYNTLGEQVKVLTNGFKNAGNYVVNFDAGNLSSGIYFYRLDAGKYCQVKKMILAK